MSPTEIEDALFAHPEKLILDACVAGVSGGRTSDEKVPRAWVVLSEAGRQQGESIVLTKLDKWIKDNLSRYKWLRGGLEVVDQVSTGRISMTTLDDTDECAGSEVTYRQGPEESSAERIRDSSNKDFCQALMMDMVSFMYFIQDQFTSCLNGALTNGYQGVIGHNCPMRNPSIVVEHVLPFFHSLHVLLH